LDHADRCGRSACHAARHPAKASAPASRCIRVCICAAQVGGCTHGGAGNDINNSLYDGAGIGACNDAYDSTKHTTRNLTITIASHGTHDQGS
jgi:hypothetical protein